MLHVTLDFLTAPSLTRSRSGQRHVIRSSPCLLQAGVTLCLKKWLCPHRGPQLASDTPRAQVEARGWGGGGRGQWCLGSWLFWCPRSGRKGQTEALGPLGSPALGQGGTWEGQPAHGGAWSLGAGLSPGWPSATTLGTAEEGRPCAAPRASPGSSLEGAGADSTPRAWLTSCTLQPQGRLSLSTLGQSQVHVQSSRSCCRTVRPNFGFSEQSHGTLCLPGLHNGHTFPPLLVSKTCQPFGFSWKGWLHLPVGWMGFLAACEPWVWGPWCWPAKSNRESALCTPKGARPGAELRQDQAGSSRVPF